VTVIIRPYGGYIFIVIVRFSCLFSVLSRLRECRLPIERDNTTWNLTLICPIYTVVAAIRNSPENISTKFLFIIFSEIALRLKGIKQNLPRLAKGRQCPELLLRYGEDLKRI
jgi:hypothetical protein